MKQLRALAEAATQGEWVADIRGGCIAVYRAELKINCMDDLDDNDKILYYDGFRVLGSWETREVDRNNAAYIAAANPAAIIALLDRLEAAQRCGSCKHWDGEAKRCCAYKSPLYAMLSVLRYETCGEWANLSALYKPRDIE